jgi:hypothetical protein
LGLSGCSIFTIPKIKIFKEKRKILLTFAKEGENYGEFPPG